VMKASSPPPEPRVRSQTRTKKNHVMRRGPLPARPLFNSANYHNSPPCPDVCTRRAPQKGVVAAGCRWGGTVSRPPAHVNTSTPPHSPTLIWVSVTLGHQTGGGCSPHLFSRLVQRSFEGRGAVARHQRPATATTTSNTK
jgi:hypothetical protein